jgi:hypothetical protein
MALTPKFSRNDLRHYMLKRLSGFETAIQDMFKQIGEEFVRDARSTNTFKDQTRNLRGSIGYIILKDGRQIFGNFHGTTVGKSEAEKLLHEIKEEYPRGFVLIVVAGMSYAAAVEAKGFDVITGSGSIAEQSLKRAIAKLKLKIK